MNPIDTLIDAVMTGAPDAVIAGLLSDARKDIAKRHAQEIRSDVNPDRCDVRIVVRLADGTERVLV